ncbi:UDP-3-O-(R-3-hydroxymyristoyl)-glucosamine N-acyltransferase [uncultured spirochete]|uniref:UDP-3-O-(R-3-hydroxymyristoyl)-glucosamine N-acyltransferase n=1 Tax=uncultured spirochete TaxID=156406 RepID=A0A3P3XRL5_9SPIR|nr:UDP-3-O-(R-3-hydroxymyristoyl)-glucosamine N-acyltransferase [uncultured spirochete]
MKLSAIKNIISDIVIVRDAEFYELGLTATQCSVSMLSFLENTKYIDELLSNATISCAIVNPETAEMIKDRTTIGIAVSESPKHSFFFLHNYLIENTDFYGQSDGSIIDPSADINSTAWISKTGVSIGAGTIIGPHVSIYPNVRIGNNVTIGANSIIGGEGFECFRFQDKAFMVKHAGNVLIGDNVDIQASCCIDKGLFKNSTIIGEYTKLDNLVHIAHNVILGRRVFIAACAMLAGRVTVGDDAWIGPSAALRNGITVGNNGYVSIGAVVTRDVLEGQMVSGNFAIGHDKFLQFIKSIR